MPTTPLQTPATTSRDRYLAAMDLSAMLASVTKHEDLWASVARRAEISPAAVERLEATNRTWHLLVLSEDWCGDAVNVVPVVARLAELATNTDLRILPRDQNLDLMDAHLTGTSRSIPVVIAYDDAFNELAWWGPRPAALQTWVMGPGRTLEPEAKYREVRAWYARDRGASTVEEIVSLLERQR